MGEAKEREARLTCCRGALLPIWKRWTDGNPALRRFLECMSADPASHEERLRLLIATTGELRRRGHGSRGTTLVAAAAMKAYVGVPEGRWGDATERALAAGREADALSRHRSPLVGEAG